MDKDKEQKTVNMNYGSKKKRTILSEEEKQVNSKIAVALKGFLKDNTID